MKFSIATIVGFATAISAANLPAAFTLVGDGGQTVLTDGSKSSSPSILVEGSIDIFYSPRLRRRRHRQEPRDPDP